MNTHLQRQMHPPENKKTVHTSVHPYKRVTNAVCISVLASEFFIISFRFEQCRPASKLGSQNKKLVETAAVYYLAHSYANYTEIGSNRNSYLI